MEDVWILNDLLDSMLLEYDENIKYLTFDVHYIQKDVDWWKYNHNNYYNIIITNYAYSIGGCYHTILSQDPMIEFNMLWLWTST